MSKKMFVVPVYYKIKADSYEDAEIIINNSVVPYGVNETAHNVPHTQLKDWSLYIGDLQK